MINKLADIGKRSDFVETGIHLLFGNAHYSTLKVDVFAPSELGVEAAAQFEQCADPAG